MINIYKVITEQQITIIIACENVIELQNIIDSLHVNPVIIIKLYSYS